jgi:hypothetical protein
MVHAALSPESKLAAELRSLNCSIRNFVAIANERGIKFSVAGLAKALSGESVLTSPDKFLGVIDSMKRLQDRVRIKETTLSAAVRISIDWSDTENIVEALTMLSLSDISKEFGGDSQIEQAAEVAVRQVQKHE